MDIDMAKDTSIRRFDKLNATFCLPPKTGSQNWLRSLDPYSQKTNGVLYRHNDRLNVQAVKKQLPLIYASRKVLNVRNPLTKLYSAWKDKFRYYQNEFDFVYVAKKKAELRTNYYIPYKDVLKPFIKPDKIVDFEAFANMVIAVKNNERHNLHWQAQYFVCGVCHIAYDLVLHTEDETSDKEQTLHHAGIATVKLVNKEDWVNEVNYRLLGHGNVHRTVSLTHIAYSRNNRLGWTSGVSDTSIQLIKSNSKKHSTMSSTAKFIAAFSSTMWCWAMMWMISFNTWID